VCECQAVRLYVDGEQFVASRRSPQIVDDWPLHRDQRVHFTKLVVGACWHGTLFGILSHAHKSWVKKPQWNDLPE